MALDSIIDNLRDGFRQLKPTSFLCVDQLNQERLTNEELRGYSFYTADGEHYHLYGRQKEPLWAITRRPHNLIVRHLDQAYKQLINTGNYHLAAQEAQRASRARDTVSIILSRLRLQPRTDVYSFLPIKTAAYEELNAEEQKAAWRVYGQREYFAKVMKMLADAKIKETAINVLNPKYIWQEAQKDAIGMASKLYNFYNDSGFVAHDRYIDIPFRLQGIRKTT